MGRKKATLFFIGRETDRGHVVLAPGTNRTDLWPLDQNTVTVLAANQQKDSSIRLIPARPGIRAFLGQFIDGRGLRRAR